MSDKLSPHSGTPVPVNRNGRKKGVRAGKQVFTIMGDVNKKALERIAKQYKPNKYGRSWKTPLEFFVDVFNDANQTNRLRLDAAKEAAQYFHYKMPPPDPNAGKSQANDSNITITVMTPETTVPPDEEATPTAEEAPAVEEKTS